MNLWQKILAVITAILAVFGATQMPETIQEVTTGAQTDTLQDLAFVDLPGGDPQITARFNTTTCVNMVRAEGAFSNSVAVTNCQEGVYYEEVSALFG